MPEKKRKKNKYKFSVLPEDFFNERPRNLSSRLLTEADGGDTDTEEIMSPPLHPNCRCAMALVID